MLRTDFRLMGSGWAACTVHADGHACEVSASYLSDALGKLVLAGVAVLVETHRVAVGFDDKPGEYRWAIVMVDSGTVRVDVLEFQALWGNRPGAEGTPLLTFSCAPLAFGEAVRTMAEDVFARYGLAGYREHWAKHDFPVADSPC